MKTYDKQTHDLLKARNLQDLEEIADDLKIKGKVVPKLPFDFLNVIPLQDVAILDAGFLTSITSFVHELNLKMRLPSELRIYQRLRGMRYVILVSVKQMIAELKNTKGRFYYLLCFDFRVAQKHGIISADLPVPTVDQRIAMLRKSYINVYQFRRMVFFYLFGLKLKRPLANLIYRHQSLISLVRLAGRKPKLQWQYNDLVQSWPCDFVVVYWAEKMYHRMRVEDDDMSFQRMIMTLINFVKAKCGLDCALAVCIKTRKIVAMDVEMKKNKFLVHSPMAMLEAFERHRGFGRWQGEITRIKAPEAPPESSRLHYNPSMRMQGVEFTWQVYLRRFFNVTFGGCDCDVKSETMFKGFELYMTTEPCMDCATSLMSRHAESVYFLKENGQNVARTFCNHNTIDRRRPDFIGYQVERNP